MRVDNKMALHLIHLSMADSWLAPKSKTINCCLHKRNVKTRETCKITDDGKEIILCEGDEWRWFWGGFSVSQLL